MSKNLVEALEEFKRESLVLSGLLKNEVRPLVERIDRLIMRTSKFISNTRQGRGK